MDEDKKAKEAARHKPGMNIVPRERPDDAAARLDKRIKEARAAHDESLDRQSKDQARASRTLALSAAYREPTARRSGGIGSTHGDVAAKSRVNSTTSPSTSQPGAISETIDSGSSSGSHHKHLLEDRAAKERAKAEASKNTKIASQTPATAIRSEIAELEAAATGKPSRASSVSSVPSQIPSHSKPTQPKTESKNKADRNLSQSMIVKLGHIHGSDCNKGIGTKSGEARADKQTSPKNLLVQRKGVERYKDLDERIAAKTGLTDDRKGETSPPISSTKPGIQFCSSLDERIANKTGIPVKQQSKASDPPKSNARPGITHCSTLDELIAYKTGIPLDNDPALEADEKQDSSTVTKLTGLAPEAISEAMEKFKARHHDDIAVHDIESKFSGQRSYFTDGNHLFEEETADTRDRLAVATVVNENEDDMFIPSAVEYDPDAKPPIYRNRRFRLYGLLVCAMLIVVIATTIGLLSQQRDFVVYVDEPTQAPTSVRYKLGIQEQLELVVGYEKLNDEGSPHFRALNWIVNDDPMQLSPDDANLVQRFLLATFYFSTHEEADWLSCNAPEEDEDQFCFYQQLVGAFPAAYKDIPWIRWLSAPHECLWAGIFCDELDQVRAIDLSGQMITSELPMELSYLPFIQGIDFAWNNIYGQIPVEYGDMKYLLTLELHYNSLSGTLQSDWSRAKNLQLLNIGSNQFTGTIPSDMSSLKGVKGLYLFDNFFTGDFPTNLNELESLVFFRAQWNNLSGTIPKNIGETEALREFWVQRMPVTGTIPSELGNLINMDDFRLQYTEIGGTIPDELWNMSQVYRIDIYEMNLNGTLSPLISQLDRLGIFRAQGNELTGQIPTEIGLMSNLQRLRLENNYFSGSVPSALCSYRGPSSLYQVGADCLNTTESIIAVTCECCDLCCNKEAGECVEIPFGG